MTRTVMTNLFNAWGATIGTKAGPRASLRWMIDPKLGLPAQHFKVWYLREPSTKLEEVDVRQRRGERDERVYDLPEPRAAASIRLALYDVSGRVRIRAHTGPRGSGQVAAERTVDASASGVTLTGPSIRSFSVQGDATVTGVRMLDLNRHVNDPDWKLVENVGLPVDKSFDGEYTMDPQGPPGALRDPITAAMVRVHLGTPAQFWPDTTDTGLPVPRFEPPDPEALVRGELQPVMEQLAKMLDRTGDRGRHVNVEMRMPVPAPRSVHGTDAPERWQDRSHATVRPLRTALLAAGGDPYAALALGFGTSIDVGSLMGPPPAVAYIPPGTRLAFKGALMVTLEHKALTHVKFDDRKVPVPIDHDLAALVALDLDEGPAAPSGLRSGGEDRPMRLDRPSGIDRPWLEVVDLSWDTVPPAADSGTLGYGVLRSLGDDDPEPAMDKRPSGGYRVFVPGGTTSGRARFTESAVPERFPGDPAEAYFSVAAQDWFGRWSPWRSIAHPRAVVDAQPPTVRSVEIDQEPSPSASVEFTWDWTDRSLHKIHIRLIVYPEGDAPPDVAGSVLSPGGPVVADHVVSFSGASPDSPPTGVTEIVDDRDGNLRTYRCTVPGVGLPFDAHPRIRFEASACAEEDVRRGVRSGFAEPAATAVADPRPPLPPATTAPMQWASLPDAAGIAHAVLRWSGSGPAYNVYIADESALSRELELPSPDLDTAAADRLDALRRRGFDGTRRAFRRLAEQLTEPKIEVDLPKGSRLIHFYAVTSVSETGVERPLPANADDYFAVAVPERLEPATPLLTARTDGASVRLAVSVNAGPVGVDRIEIGRVRGAVNAASPEAAGAPVIVADAASAETAGGRLQWELEETDALPPWEPVFYRAVAVAATDQVRGQIPGRSHPTPAVEVVVPSASGPTLSGLTVAPAAGGATVTVDTDASRRRTALGVFTVAVTAVDAAGAATSLRGEVAALKAFTGALPADAPDLCLHRPTTAHPYRVTARVPEPVSVAATVTDPLGRRANAFWSTS